MEDTNTIIEKKLILCAVSLLLTAGMLWSGKIEAINFENINVWVVGLFVTGEAAGLLAKRYPLAVTKKE